MIIAFSGASGSGKTTLLKRLEAAHILRERKVEIKEEDRFFLLRILKRIFGNQAIDVYQAETLNLTRPTGWQTNLTHIAVRIVFPIIILIEFIFDYIKYEVLYKDKILLKDRYIYDYLVTLEENFGIKSKFWSKIFLSFPRSALQFYIDISPQTALERNKNESKGALTRDIKFHRRIINHYQKIANTKKILTIPNNSKTEHAADLIVFHTENKLKFSKMKRIVVCGQDGVGKTTLLNLLKEYLVLLNISSQIVHFYHDNLVYKILKKFGIIKKYPQNEEHERNRNRNILVNAKGKPLIWAMFHFLDSFVQYTLSIIFFSGRFIIYDRFFYDYSVSFPFLRVPNYQVLTRLAPKVRPVVVLIGDPRVSYQRKPENTLEYFEYSHTQYKKLAEDNDYVLIDTHEKKPDEVFDEFIKKIGNGL